ITNGGEADTYIVFARTSSGSGSAGISAFIVDKDAQGLIIGKDEHKMGLNGSRTVQLIFENTQVPLENLLGEEGQG
ncbi:acyl-CoA dehydrogenase, partial [Shouchella clausii]